MLSPSGIQRSSSAVSQQKRTRVEEYFSWMKIVELLRKVKLSGVLRVEWLFTFCGGRL